MEEINIKDFFQYLLKYVAVMVLFTVVCLLGTFVYDKVFKKPMYTTSTTIVLVKNDNSNNTTNNNSTGTIDNNDIVLNQKLVSTYSQIIKSRLVLNQVVERLKLKSSYEEIYKEVGVQAVDETEILKISVTDADAQTATDIANVIATVFDKEVTKIYNINNVSVIDKAIVPENPSNNTFMRDMVLALFASAVISTALVFVIYYFDDTVRDTATIENEVDLPIIAKVFKDDSDVELIVDKKPKAIASESIRTLRTNLQFASIDSELKTILVTSTLPGEGKSFVSANLAISFAQAGKKVLLIDCDLRKGRQHKIFKLTGKRGLSNLLISDIKKFPEYIYETKIENLSLIPRGVFPPNPSELLSSKKNSALIDLLKKYFDIIILDGAPCSGLSDSLILSSIVDKVLLVSSINFTPKSELINTKKALENVGAKIAGCVANNISSKTGTYGGKYYYYYNYGYGEKN